MQNRPVPEANGDDEVLLCHIKESDRFNSTSLVLSSAALPHRVVVAGGGRSFSIFIRRSLLAEAQRQLAAYELESHHWPPPKRADLSAGFPPLFKVMPLLVILTLLLFHRQSGDWSGQSRWFAAGSGDAVKILDGEWFRTVTALTLHADSFHLLANLVSAALFLPFLFAVTGSGLGIFTVVVTSAIANFCNALAHNSGHLSVGFSTAIFSTIGILSTFGISLPHLPGEPLRRRLLRLLLPPAGGLAFVAMLGTGSPTTDLGAHLFGIFCGVIAGGAALLPGFDRLRRSISVQLTAGLATLLLLVLCWQKALSSLPG